MNCTASASKWICHSVNVLLAIVGFYVVLFTAIGPEPCLRTYYIDTIGGITLIASIVGLFGIFWEKVLLTAVYIIFICISFILQVCGIIFADLIGNITSDTTAYVNMLWDENDGLNESMDLLQREYKCCGKSFLYDHRDPPESCFDSHKALIYTKGCIHVLIEERTKPPPDNIACLVITGLTLIFAIFWIIRLRMKQRKSNQ